MTNIIDLYDEYEYDDDYDLTSISEQYYEADGKIGELRDAMESAFNAMQSTGKIVAEQDFCDCQSCGIAGAAEMSDGQFAYVFFHNQDTEGLLADGEVYLAYGTFEGNEYRDIAVGRIVSVYLRNAGLTVEWNGQPDTRLLVKLA